MSSASYIAQRITNAIAYIHRQLKFFLLNYINDFVGVEERERAWIAFNNLGQLLVSLGVVKAKDKTVPPTTIMEFLDITFNSETMTIEIPPDKIKVSKAELHTWLYKTSAKRKEVESLIGKTTVCSQMCKSRKDIPGKTDTLANHNGQEAAVQYTTGGQEGHHMVGKVHLQWHFSPVADERARVGHYPPD